jgi:hypothetical protein
MYDNSIVIKIPTKEEPAPEKDHFMGRNRAK